MNDDTDLEVHGVPRAAILALFVLFTLAFIAGAVARVVT
jgi:hypothetical protein